MATRRWGGVRKGAGRPPKARAEVQRNRVVLLLTDNEYERLRSRAEGRAIGTVAREILVRALKPKPRIPRGH